MGARGEDNSKDSPGISGSSKFATADRTSGYGDSMRGNSVKMETDVMGWRRTVINSIFVKVRVERGVIILIVGVVRVG